MSRRLERQREKLREQVIAELTDRCTRLGESVQLLPGSQIHWNGTLQDVHQTVYDTSGEKVTILGVEIWNDAAQDVRFVPWHAVQLVIPPDPED